MSVTAAVCTGFVLYRGTALILADAMTVGELTVFLAYLSKFFKPVQDLAKMSNSIAQTSVAIERIQTILDADMVVPERAGARDPGHAPRARSCSITSPSPTIPRSPCSRT